MPRGWTSLGLATSPAPLNLIPFTVPASVPTCDLITPVFFSSPVPTLLDDPSGGPRPLTLKMFQTGLSIFLEKVSSFLSPSQGGPKSPIPLAKALGSSFPRHSLPPARSAPSPSPQLVPALSSPTQGPASSFFLKYWHPLSPLTIYLFMAARSFLKC